MQAMSMAPPRDAGVDANNAIIALVNFYAAALGEERAKVQGLRAALASEERMRAAVELDLRRRVEICESQHKDIHEA